MSRLEAEGAAPMRLLAGWHPFAGRDGALRRPRRVQRRNPDPPPGCGAGADRATRGHSVRGFCSPFIERAFVGGGPKGLSAVQPRAEATALG
jgi:hypothetical protein